MAPTIVQQSPLAWTGRGGQTLTATLPASATAGNMLWWIASGDKNIGSLTLPAGWAKPVELRSGSVSLSMAWKVAAGGETTISGTVTGSNPAGCDVWLAEFAESGTGAWEILGSATGPDTGANITSRSTGTTAATTGAGRGIAAWAIDSYDVIGADTYSNGYALRTKTDFADSGNSGLWIAERDVADNATTGSTLDRFSGAPTDQICGAVVVFGRGAPPFVVHDAAATFTGAGALNSTARRTARSAATLAGAGAMTAAAQVGHRSSVTLSGSGALTTTAARARPAAATFAGAGQMTAAVTRGQPITATFAGAGGMLANAGELGAAVFAGAGSLTVDAVRQDHAATVALAGSGALSTAARSTQRVGSTFTGVGQLLAGAARVQLIEAAFVGAGQLLADGRRVHPGEVELTGAGSLFAEGIRTRPAATTFTGAGRLLAAARVARPGLNISLWAVLGDGLAPLPGFAKLDFSRERNAVGSVTLDYPAGAPGFPLLYAGVDDDRDVEVEIWLGGNREGALRGLLEQAAGDDLDSRAVWTFSGAFLERLLAQAIVYPQPAPAEKGELVFSGRNAGEIAATVLNEAQARGGLVGMTRDWTTAVDSTGFAWPQTVSSLKFSPRTSLLQVLQKLVDLDLAEFEVTAERVLRLWAPGRRGVDRSTGNDAALFRHGRTVGAPVRHSVRESATTVLVAGADGVYREASDASALARRGRRIEVGLDANNLADVAAVAAYAAQALTTVTPGQNEIRHGLTFGPGDPRPGAGFDLADKVVSERAGGARIAVDLQQYTLAVTRSEVTGEVVLNDRIASRLERLRRQLDAIGSGAAVIGTSQPPDLEDTEPPAAPIGVTADSIVDPVGNGRTVSVALVGWTAVTTNADGTAADDVAGYRVEWRLASSTGWQLGRDVPGGQAESTSFGGVEAGVDIVIRVAAYDSNGNTSAWSAQVAITTETDATAPPTPSTPTAFSRLGVLMVEWDGLGSVGEAMPADFDYVEVHMSAAAGFAPVEGTYYDRLYAAGTMPVVDQAFGVAKFFKLVAVDRTTPVANRSGASGQASATPSKVVSDDIFAGAVGTLALADLAVKTAKIDLLAVNDAQFGSGSFGKITAGVMSVAMTLTGIIRTASTGLRWEGDPAGIRFYNSSGVETIRLEGAVGNTTITGTIRSGTSGTRWAMEQDGTLRHYSSGFSGYSQLDSVNGDLIMRGRMDSNGRSGRLNVGPIGVGINFSNDAEVPDDLRSEVVVFDRRVQITSPVLYLTLDKQYQPGLGGPRRIEFRAGDNSTPAIAQSVTNWRLSASDDPMFVNPFYNCGVAWATNRLIAVTGDGGAFQIMKALSYEQPSSQRVKDRIADARSVIDPIAMIRGARARSFVYESEKWRTPPPTDEHPDPEPVAVEPPVRIGVLAEDLPDVLVADSPDRSGGTTKSVDLGSWLGAVHGAVGQILDQEIRSVAGRAEMPPRSYLPGNTVEVDVAWDETPLEVPTGGIVTIAAAIAWLGKTTARIIPDSLTAVGCRVEIRALAVVVPRAANPITVEAQALYLWSPPYDPT